jgi:hypothetical protein
MVGVALSVWRLWRIFKILGEVVGRGRKEGVYSTLPHATSSIEYSTS